MPIELKTEKGISRIDEGNFAESMQEIESKLKPGTPILFQQFNWSDLSMGGGRHAERLLFFSGGHLSKEGVFDLQRGKRNFSYVMISENDPTSFRIVHHWKELLDNHVISVPKEWTMRQSNEGTFSPAGPSEWSSLHSAGTENIIIGDILVDQFPDAINALRFARDAVYFPLNPFYSMQSYLVTETDDSKEQEGQRDNQTHRIACLRACINLINEAERQVGEYRESMVAHQVGYYKDGAQRFREKGHPVDSKDYLIRELLHPGRNVALIKTGGGIMYGETYILPFSNEMNNIVELAFSKDMVQKHYPHGL